MFKASVNKKINFVIEKNGKDLIVDGEVVNFDAKSSHGGIHILQGLKSYNAEVIQVDVKAKKAVIRINGNNYSVEVKDQYDQLLEQLGMNESIANTVSDLKAPMPGLVLKVFVKEGDKIKKGDNLLILEAMKMENLIKAPSDVVVKEVNISEGNRIEKGEILIKFY